MTVGGIPHPFGRVLGDGGWRSGFGTAYDLHQVVGGPGGLLGRDGASENDHRWLGEDADTDNHRGGAMTVLDLDRGTRDEQATVAVEQLGQLRSSTSVMRPWERTYVRLLMAVDVVLAIAAAAAGVIVSLAHFGDRAAVLASLTPLVWLALQTINRSYDARFLFEGSEEFRRTTRSAFHGVMLVAVVAYIGDYNAPRAWTLTALPVLLLVDLLARYAMRKYVHRQRIAGRYGHRVLVVGHEAGVLDLMNLLSHSRHHGFKVVGACLPIAGQRPELIERGVAVAGDFSSVVEAVATTSADTVAVLASPEFDSVAMRRLAWGLERTGVDLVVAPALMDVAGPRLSIRPAAGLPLLHVEHPRLEGGKKLLKGGFDRTCSLLGILAISPILITIAVLVKGGDGGAVLYKQTRIGKDGREFKMWKFRSMVTNADKLLAELEATNEAQGPLFKMKRDPRITKVGAVLRKFSLDELPQLINVLKGDMSLVGPRPPLPTEVAAYGADVHRRLVVKPGITGLWQVSGRSDLTWEESVRLDLRYVDNWSLGMDGLILWKTARAVAKGEGAY